jgi:hypothetical protein
MLCGPGGPIMHPPFHKEDLAGLAPSVTGLCRQHWEITALSFDHWKNFGHKTLGGGMQLRLGWSAPEPSHSGTERFGWRP